MVLACHMPQQPLQNHLSGHLGGPVMPWSAEEMLDGQHASVDIPAHARTAHKGLLQKSLEEDLCWIVPHAPPMTQSRELVGWCFKPGQPQGIISRLKTNSNPSLSYSAHKSFKTNLNISTAQFKYFTTHTHNISTEVKYFFVTITIFLYIKFTSTNLILYRTYQSLSGRQTLSLDSHFGTVKGLNWTELRIGHSELCPHQTVIITTSAAGMLTTCQLQASVLASIDSGCKEALGQPRPPAVHRSLQAKNQFPLDDRREG